MHECQDPTELCADPGDPFHLTLAVLDGARSTGQDLGEERSAVEYTDVENGGQHWMR
ncbi:MAG: hypothetical protein ACI9OJ_003960 [Myxococcota bacterium]|jgi:hypothetical protein